MATFSRYGSVRSSTILTSNNAHSSFELSQSNNSKGNLVNEFETRSHHGSPKSIQSKLVLASPGESTHVKSPLRTQSDVDDNISNLTQNYLKSFEDKYQLTVSLSALNDTNLVNELVHNVTSFYVKIENALNVFTICCLARQKHKTLEVIGLIICDIEQIFNILEFFCFLTKDYEEILYGQIIELKDDTQRSHSLIKKMLKYSIIPPLDPKYIKDDVFKVKDSMNTLMLELISYLIQRLLAYVSIKKNNQLLKSFATTIGSITINRKKKFHITQKLESWLIEKSICAKCNRDIGIQPCIKELKSHKKWHMVCCRCSMCNKRLLDRDLMGAFVDQADSSIICSKCSFGENADNDFDNDDFDSNTGLMKATSAITTRSSSDTKHDSFLTRVNNFVRVSSKQQAVSLLKSSILETIQELEDENYGYICQEWIKYWRMDSDDINKFDKKTQKIQSSIFELIHCQQFFVDSATDFLNIGERFLTEANERPNELDPELYNIIFKPVKELRKIHKRLLLSPMTRFLSDQGMIIKNQIFKLYLTWINKSYYAYDEYLVKLAESELMQDIDKMKSPSYLSNWIKQQNSTKLEKLLSGGFYYQMIQTKEIMKGLERLLDPEDHENLIAFQTSMLIEKYSFQLHSILDRSVTKAYLARIQNLEVKRTDVRYKKHVYVKYKSKSTNEMVDCCLILLNMCLVITKFSPTNSMFIKFAPLIFNENLEYERSDAKLFIYDKSKKEIEPYKFYFRKEEDAINWVNINV